MTGPASPAAPEADRQERIVAAVLALLATGGIASVSIRAVAKQAGVALGLVNYYFVDKTGLIRAALLRIAEQDLALVEPDAGEDPEAGLRRALKLVAEPEFLTTEYLSLRLQLWSLAQAHEDFARINAEAQQRYRERLADLIARARPGLVAAECARRAADVDVIQNGIWLTALLVLDEASVHRAVTRCEQIALAT